MAKQPRPSLLDSISADMTTTPAATPAGQGAVVPMKPAPAATAKPEVVKSTIYLPPQAHRKLKEIAFAKDCKVHDLIMAGISRVLQEHGYPTVDELKEK